MKDLFGQEMPELVVPDRALTKKERRKLLYGQIGTVPKGHAWTPGSGPAGETCKTCAHITRNKWGRVYLKCGLTKAKWTHGPGSDIRARDPACKFWKKGD